MARVKDAEATLTLNLEKFIQFKILKDNKPLAGAKVTIMDKGLSPKTITKETDSEGVARFNIFDFILVYGIQVTLIGIPQPWLILAYQPESPYGAWKDEVRLQWGKQQLYTLKHYTEVPTFYMKFTLKDIIGRDLFASVIAAIEQFMLGWAGFKVTKVKGQGTNSLTIYFQPPFTESSPISVVGFAAIPAWQIALILLLVGIVFLVVLKWTFGEEAKLIPWIILIAVASPIAIAAISLISEERERGKGA